jgi:hypothetical protein
MTDELYLVLIANFFTTIKGGGILPGSPVALRFFLIVYSGQQISFMSKDLSLRNEQRFILYHKSGMNENG